MSAPASNVLTALHTRLQDLALTLRSTGAAEQLEVIEAERDKLAVVSTSTPIRECHMDVHQLGVSAPASCMIADRKKSLTHRLHVLAQMTVAVHAQHTVSIEATSFCGTAGR